jgi:hypothetical protein
MTQHQKAEEKANKKNYIKSATNHRSREKITYNIRRFAHDNPVKRQNNEAETMERLIKFNDGGNLLVT